MKRALVHADNAAKLVERALELCDEVSNLPQWQRDGEGAEEALAAAKAGVDLASATALASIALSLVELADVVDPGGVLEAPALRTFSG